MNEDFIFRPNGNSEETTTETVQDKFYTVIGEQEFLDEDGYSRVNENSNRIYAKSVGSEGVVKYYVKSSKYGQLYNPIGLYSEGKHNRYNKILGADEYKFKRVNARIFELYINFLKTKNIAWINNAEREIK